MHTYHITLAINSQCYQSIFSNRPFFTMYLSTSGNDACLLNCTVFTTELNDCAIAT
jgi:hypothetical protein